jgi:hypothetical protein
MHGLSVEVAQMLLLPSSSVSSVQQDVALLELAFVVQFSKTQARDVTGRWRWSASWSFSVPCQQLLPKRCL